MVLRNDLCMVYTFGSIHLNIWYFDAIFFWSIGWRKDWKPCLQVIWINANVHIYYTQNNNLSAVTDHPFSGFENKKSKISSHFGESEYYLC